MSKQKSKAVHHTYAPFQRTAHPPAGYREIKLSKQCPNCIADIKLITYPIFFCENCGANWTTPEESSRLAVKFISGEYNRCPECEKQKSLKRQMSESYACQSCTMEWQSLTAWQFDWQRRPAGEVYGTN